MKKLELTDLSQMLLDSPKGIRYLLSCQNPTLVSLVIAIKYYPEFTTLDEFFKLLMPDSRGNKMFLEFTLEQGISSDLIKQI